jgi:hypothetical protein
VFAAPIGMRAGEDAFTRLLLSIQEEGCVVDARLDTGDASSRYFFTTDVELWKFRVL